MRVLLLVFFSLCAAAAHAGDGALGWRTIDTPHFQVHYPPHLEAFATRSARLSEEAHRVLVPIFGHAPDRRTQVVITDYGDAANGSATALPYPRVRLFAAPPALDGNLGDYDSWLRLLIFHEYTHILQLDNVRGLPALLNELFGKRFAPNHVLPSFHLEGAAVWAESLTSGRGRIRSATFRGILRAQALAGRLHGVDAVTHAPKDWPGANVWYMYGGHFMHWLTQRYGRDVPAQIFASIADELLPYGLNRAYMEATGVAYTTLYAQWLDDLRARALRERAALAAAGLTPLRMLTSQGDMHRQPRFDEAGQLLLLESAGRKANGVYARDAHAPLDADATLRFKTDATGGFDPCLGGRMIYDQTDTHHGAYNFADLHLANLRTGDTQRITRGARIRRPACAPNGRWAAAVQVVNARTRLVQVDLSDGHVRTLLDPERLNQVGQPAVSPDGRTVVTPVISDRDGRDLWAVDVATGARRRLTHDGALELRPRFSPDGEWLVYLGDRGGVFDVYAYAWPHGPAQRVTRLVNGAQDVAITPDGQRMVLSVITADGSDLAVAPFTPTLPIPAPLDLPQPPRPAASAVAPPSRPYTALESLWPMAWAPTFAFSDATGSASSLGVDLELSDATGEHYALANIGSAPEEDALNLSVSYGYYGLVPSLAATFSHTTSTDATGALYGSARRPFQRRVSSGSLGLSLPFKRGSASASTSIRYSFSQLDPAENLDPIHDPFERSPVIPDTTRRGSLSIGLSASDLDAYRDAITHDAGRTFSVTLRLRHPRLGGTLETAEVFFNYAEYLGLWGRHGLAVRLNGGLGRGDTAGRIFYSLSPAPERDVLLDLLDEIAFGSTFLRGYPVGTVGGDRYLLGAAEYRLPLWDVFAGLGTAPIFLNHLRLSLFTDWAQAASQPLEASPSAFRRSVGAEILAEGLLGWRRLATLRIGYAQGLDEDGEGQTYLFLGRWF